MKRLVVKIGTNVLTRPDGSLDVTRVSALVDQVVRLREMGYAVVIVSSGAVACGRTELRLDDDLDSVEQRQLYSAVGQVRLMDLYYRLFRDYGLSVGQVLTTKRNFETERERENQRACMEVMLAHGVVPVVNENDTVSPTEFQFGDNDMLGAIVSVLVGADLYVILSDVDGLHTENPAKNPDAPLIERVERITPEVVAMGGEAGTAIGTGGMATKLRAARAMISAGIPMVICKGRGENPLLAAAAGTVRGTRFEAPGGNHEAPRKRWIGLAGVSMGTLTVDKGAERALKEKGASLLPVGVREVHGNFESGDVVSVTNTDGELIGRGLVRYSSTDMKKVQGLRSDVIARFLPEKADQPAVHRDELLVF